MSYRNPIQPFFKFLLLLILICFLNCTQSSIKLLNTLTTSIPENGTTWSYGSKQKIKWFIPDLPAEKYEFIFYLENLVTGEKGYIYKVSPAISQGEINYVANYFINKNEQIEQLRNGHYQLSAKLFNISDKNNVNKIDKCTHKVLANIRIIDSDVKD